MTLSSLARLPLYENGHGYRAGNRYLVSALVERPLSKRWHAGAALELLHESPERWDGVIEEEEGNLGRTDLLATLAAAWSVGEGAGAMRFSVSVPIVTRSRGAQLDYPLLVSVGFAR